MNEHRYAVIISLGWKDDETDEASNQPAGAWRRSRDMSYRGPTEGSTTRATPTLR
jgi:hypothetical protein